MMPDCSWPSLRRELNMAASFRVNVWAVAQHWVPTLRGECPPSCFAARGCMCIDLANLLMYNKRHNRAARYRRRMWTRCWRRTRRTWRTCARARCSMAPATASEPPSPPSLTPPRSCCTRCAIARRTSPRARPRRARHAPLSGRARQPYQTVACMRACSRAVTMYYHLHRAYAPFRTQCNLLDRTLCCAADGGEAEGGQVGLVQGRGRRDCRHPVRAR